MYTRKDVAIWIAILGGGIGFFLFYGVFIKNFCEIIMYTRKDVAIWIAILGGGIGFFLFYGIAADLMR